MKVVICHSHVSGYIAACWRALLARAELDLHIVAQRSSSKDDASFADAIVEGLPCRLLSPEEQADAPLVRSLVMAHRPDVLVVPGWAVPAYTQLVQSNELASTRIVMGMDTPWRGSPRQHLARLWIGGYLRRMDRIVVAGERAWQYAVRLGIPENRIRRGLYGIDFDAFASLYARRTADRRGWPRKFLFVGRYVDVKGIDVLLGAYQKYRSQVQDPWALVCCGQGPLGERMAKAEGVDDLGFRQPHQLPEVFLETGVFVLASRYEPWGVALAEACASGLPVICTEACGAAIEIVRQFYNGLSVATGDADALTHAMRWMHDHCGELHEMGRRGQELSRPFSAQMWAMRWSEMLKELAL